MFDKFKTKTIAIIAGIIALLFIAKNIIIDMIISKGKEKMDDAIKRDRELLLSAQKANENAENFKKRAEEKEEEIKNIKEDEEWNKR